MRSKPIIYRSFKPRSKMIHSTTSDQTDSHSSSEHVFDDSITITENAIHGFSDSDSDLDIDFSSEITAEFSNDFDTDTHHDTTSEHPVIHKRYGFRYGLKYCKPSQKRRFNNSNIKLKKNKKKCEVKCAPKCVAKYEPICDKICEPNCKAQCEKPCEPKYGPVCKPKCAQKYAPKCNAKCPPKCEPKCNSKYDLNCSSSDSDSCSSSDSSSDSSWSSSSSSSSDCELIIPPVLPYEELIYNRTGPLTLNLDKRISIIDVYSTLGLQGNYSAQVLGPGNKYTGYSKSIITDTDSNAYTIFYTDSNPVIIYNSNSTIFATVPTSGNFSVFVVKYNQIGMVTWYTMIDGMGTEFSYNVKVDSLNNVYVAGYYDSNPLTFYNSDHTAYATTLPLSSPVDLFLAKYSSSGFVQWITHITGETMGDPTFSNRLGCGLTCDSFNNVIIAHRYNSASTVYNSDATTFGVLPLNGVYDIGFVKYTTNGIGIWASHIARNDQFDYVNGINIDVDSVDNILLASYALKPDPIVFYNSDGTNAGSLTDGSAATEYIFACKYTPLGFLQWNTKIVGPHASALATLKVDNYDNVYVAFASDDPPSITVYNSNTTIAATILGNGGCLVKYDSIGNYIWGKTNVSGGDYFLNLDVDSHNNIYGIAFNKLIKYDENGVQQLECNITRSASELNGTISIDKYDNVYLIGDYYTTTLGIYNSDNSLYKTLPIADSSDIFVVKYTPHETVIFPNGHYIGQRKTIILRNSVNGGGINILNLNKNMYDSSYNNTYIITLNMQGQALEFEWNGSYWSRL